MLIIPERDVYRLGQLQPEGGTFFFGNAPVRTMVRDGEIWFVAKDVCEVLGYSNSRDAIAKHQATNLELFKLALGSIEETARRVDNITEVNTVKVLHLQR